MKGNHTLCIPSSQSPSFQKISMRGYIQMSPVKTWQYFCFPAVLSRQLIRFQTSDLISYLQKLNCIQDICVSLAKTGCNLFCFLISACQRELIRFQVLSPTRKKVYKSHLFPQFVRISGSTWSKVDFIIVFRLTEACRIQQFRFQTIELIRYPHKNNKVMYKTEVSILY